jgi:hypothetical protein
MTERALDRALGDPYCLKHLFKLYSQIIIIFWDMCNSGAAEESLNFNIMY